MRSHCGRRRVAAAGGADAQPEKVAGWSMQTVRTKGEAASLHPPFALLWQQRAL